MGRTINIGVLAHVDAGKTTTVEQMLFRTGTILSAGSIEKGNTQTDFLDVERKRGISVRASATAMELGDLRVNIIDTPGHIDFSGEVERALLALDAVILVISAMEGVQSQTEVFWKAVRALDMPVILFVNKIDRAGCVPEVVRDALRAQFSPAILELNTYANAGGRDCSVVPRAFDEDDAFILAEVDDAIAELLMLEEIISSQALTTAAYTAAQAGKLFPLVYGAAALGTGIQDLLDAIGHCFSPQDEAGDEPFSAIVYKIEHDQSLGKVAHVRVFGGAVRNKDIVTIQRPDEDENLSEKVNQIFIPNSSRREDKPLLLAGQVGAICGLGSARTGDVLGETLFQRYYPLATPLFSVEIKTDPGKMPALLKAVAELSDEDPLLDYKWAPDERELFVQIMGPIQLEVIDSLLRERYNLAVEFSAPSVIYKETPAASGIGFEAYTMPKPCWAIIKLEITPRQRGAGYRFSVGNIRNETLDTRYQRHIEQCLPRALKQGFYNWEVVDLDIKLIDGGHHIYHTHPLDFFLATPLALLDGLKNCGSTLLEPMMDIRMEADESLSGKLIGEVLAMRGTFDAPVMKNNRLFMQARVPVATSREFPIRFASLTSGKGQYKSLFDGYEPCPIELGVVAKRRGVDPRDRAKWILAMRSAL